MCKVNDFRGISLTSVVYKAMCSVVHRRLVHMVDEKQLVAEEGRGCRDQLMKLVLLGQLKAVLGEGMLVSFIDFKIAYDRVNLGKLWGCLKGMGIGGRALAFMKVAYSEVSCEVKVGAGHGDPFEVSCGLRQGCILFPLLFSLFINSIVARLKEAEVAVKCGSKLISMLLYADDAVIFAEDEKSMRSGLDVLMGWCREWSVEVNGEKCGVIHMRRKGVKRTENKFYVGEEEIAIVKEYKYLGCVVNEHERCRRMVEERAKAGAVALSNWLRRCRASVGEVRGGTFGKLLEMFVGSVLLYGVEVWGCGRQLKPIEEVQMRAARIFMGVGRLHPLASLQFEMNMLPVKWEAMKRSIEFWVHVMRLGEGRLLKEVMREAMKFGGRVQGVKDLRIGLETFGWQGLDMQALSGLSTE